MVPHNKFVEVLKLPPEVSALNVSAVKAIKMLANSSKIETHGLVFMTRKVLVYDLT